MFQIGGTGNATSTCSVREGNRRKTRSGFCNQRKLLFTEHFGVSACLLKHLLLTIADTASPSNQGIPICGEISQFPLYTSDPSLLMSSREACDVIFDSMACKYEAVGIKNQNQWRFSPTSKADVPLFPNFPSLHRFSRFYSNQDGRHFGLITLLFDVSLVIGGRKPPVVLTSSSS